MVTKPGRRPKRSTRGSIQRTGLTSRFRRALGLRASYSFQGVRYKERTTDTLRDALSRRGPGFKEYEVTFRSGARLQIRCTRERIFADLTPPPTLPVLMRAEHLLRPGMRVLVKPCGTGFGASVVAGRVAPSGAVVALDSDEQSIAFARLRYPIPNVSFECGGLAELRGETDGAFDAAIVIHPVAHPPEEADIAELWRIIGPGGWLLVAHAAGHAGTGAPDSKSDLPSIMARLCRDEADSHPASTSHIGALGDGRDGWAAAVAHRKSME